MSSAKREENRQVALILTNTLGTNVVYPTGVALADSTPAHVAVVDGNGDQITTMGDPTPLFAPIAVSANGVTNLVSAQASKIIRVLQVVIMSNGAVNVKFQSHATPTDITGLFYLVANTGFSSGYSKVGQFQTVAGEALDINLSAGVAVGGYLVYTLI